MEARFDIDILLEQVMEEDVSTIVSCIREPEVLDYLAHMYNDDEEMLYNIIRNGDTSRETVEYIARVALKNGYQVLVLSNLRFDSRISDDIRSKIERFWD